MIHRSDIEKLQAVREFPAVSILLPTHRGGPDVRQDPVRLKNLLREAAERLHAALPRKEAEPVLAKLQALAEDVDWDHLGDGLAVFASPRHQAVHVLPFPVAQRVVVDETFLTRDLVHAYNRSVRYWVLVLSEKPTRLFHGSLDLLREVDGNGFPLVHEGPGGEAPLPFGFGINKSAYRDEHHRRFFRSVDSAFGRFAASDPLPLVLVGVERHLAFFDEVTRHGDLVAGKVHGSHDTTPPHGLARLVWPAMEEYMARTRERVLEDLEAAAKARRVASGLAACWKAAAEGRGAVLVVEDGYHRAGRLEASGFELTPLGEPSPEGAAPEEVVEDAVDDLVELVLSMGGKVVFAEEGRLGAHERVALILRY